jgi:hypothetical protein
MLFSPAIRSLPSYEEEETTTSSSSQVSTIRRRRLGDMDDKIRVELEQHGEITTIASI